MNTKTIRFTFQGRNYILRLSKELALTIDGKIIKKGMKKNELRPIINYYNIKLGGSSTHSHARDIVKCCGWV